MLSDCGGALNYGAYLQQDRVGSKMEFRVRRGRTLCLAIFLVSLLVCYAIIPYTEPPVANKKGRDNLESQIRGYTVKVGKHFDVVTQPFDVVTQPFDADPKSDTPFDDRSVHLAAVACGGAIHGAKSLIKSLLLWEHSHTVLHLFADSEAKAEIDRFPSLDRLTEGLFQIKIYPVSYPTEGNEEAWRSLFKPCATERLFLPRLLKDVKSVIYVDTDTLFLSSPLLLWQKFSEMGPFQVVGMVPESEGSSTWYSKRALHPFYGRVGLNSGVMLLDLEKIRNQTNWQSEIEDIYSEFRNTFVWGDQDILNVYFHNHPAQLYEVSCIWNYRQDHCMLGNTCDTSETGLGILHGSRGSFRKRTEFKILYNYFEEVDLNLILSDRVEFKNQLFHSVSTDRALLRIDSPCVPVILSHFKPHLTTL